MSKLSFVALSLQTTHLDPASVSKVSYVKLVDGNITRQDDILIIPPTNNKKSPNGQANESQTSWDEALEQLGMMIGKLPIVSYYRDADKEIFHAASRQVNVEPPVYHWLDCRELARKLLPDLSDVQLSTVLKTLDLYDDYADSNVVEQTTQIVIALAQQHGANTVAQLWDELYDQPDDLLGLDSTFEGTADSGSGWETDEPVDVPLAAEALPFAGAAASSTQRDENSEPTATEADETVHSSEPADDQPIAEPVTPEDEPGVAETGHTTTVESLTPLEAVEESTLSDEDDLSTTADELPVFLQQPTRDEQERADSEPADTETDHNGTFETATETGTTSIEAPGANEDRLEVAGATGDDNDQLVESTGIESPIPDQDAEELHDTDVHSQPHTADPAADPPIETHETPSVETAVEEQTEHNELDEPAFLQEPVHEGSEKPEEAPAEADQEDSATTAQTPADTQPGTSPELPETSSSADVPTDATTSESPASPPAGHRSEPSGSTAATALQSVDVADRPRAEPSAGQTSKTNKLFGFVGLFVFGVLTIIGVVLVVMAVMLFFTENSLMLETKIAGVILTVAITLLSVLMTNVSYRSFRHN